MMKKSPVKNRLNAGSACVRRLVLPGFDSWKRRVEDRVEKDPVICRLRRLREVGEIEEWQYVHRFNLRFCKIVTIIE